MVKLLMKWDIKSGQEQAYFEFVMQEFAPGLMGLGLQPTEAWYSAYGQGPQILTGVVTEDLATMHRILDSDDWHTLIRAPAGPCHELQSKDRTGKRTVSAVEKFPLFILAEAAVRADPARGRLLARR